MIDLRDHFGAAFVLNLDIRSDRWREFQERAEKAGVTGFTRYRAIEGDRCPPPAWWRAGNGAWGCLMSHLRVAQDAMLDGLESYVVFEDDAVFSDDFAERLSDTMERLKKTKWHQLYLGGQHLWVEAGPPWPHCEGVVRCRNVNRTHAFAVHRRFMAKFSQHIIHAPDYIEQYTEKPPGPDGKPTHRPFVMHIDHQLGKLHEKREHMILATNPWLCGQGASSSNISGKTNSELWWNSTGWGE